MTSTSAKKPAWLTPLDDLADELGTVGRETAVFVRDLLLAPDEEGDATAKAIHALQTYYRAEFCPPDNLSWQHDPSRGADGTLSVIGTVIPHVFQVVQFVPFNDVRHKRLADLIIGLKKAAPLEFNPEDPQLGFNDLALFEEASEAWHSYYLAPNDPTTQCSISLNVYTLLARLTEQLLEANGVRRAAAAITDGLEKPASSDSTAIVLETSTVIATQYVLFAGDVLARFAKSPRQGEEHLLGKEKWKIWADKLQNIAETASKGEWDLQANAQKAYTRMVELWPELFAE